MRSVSKSTSFDVSHLHISRVTYILLNIHYDLINAFVNGSSKAIKKRKMINISHICHLLLNSDRIKFRADL